MSNPLLLEIHRYWFGELKSPGDHLPNTGELWFRKSDETDAHIRETYEPFIHEAAGKEWDISSLTREEGVALVVLFDQFPRNIFRDSGMQFAFDAKAREIAEALTGSGPDRFFSIERDLLSLPFQHHEDAASQDLVCAHGGGYGGERAGEHAPDAPQLPRLRLQTPRPDPQIRPLSAPQRPSWPDLDAGGTGLH